MNARDDESYYRGLLESAQKGIENAKAFLEAVGTSQAALVNVAIQSSSNMKLINFGINSRGSWEGPELALP
jgi:hypothetical protein